MALRLANLAAAGAALAALLVGLAGGSPFWTIVTRVVASYLVFFAVASVLSALARIGLASQPEQRPRKASADDPGQGGGGTESADSL